MGRWRWLTRATALSGAIVGTILLMSLLPDALLAQTRPECPCPCPNTCVPKPGWGYYDTKWRLWPGEPLLEETNTRGTTSEVVPTPEGYKEKPLPTITRQELLRQQQLQQEQQEQRALQQQQQQQQQQQEPLQQAPQPPEQQLQPPSSPGSLPSVPPGNELPPGGGVILPPEGMLIPNNPPEKSGTKPTPSTPSPEAQLPDLPPAEPSPPADHSPAKQKPSGHTEAPLGVLMPVVETPRETPPLTSSAPAPSELPLRQVSEWSGSQNAVQRTAAKPLATSGAGDSAVVPLTGAMEPERNDVLPGTGRADSTAAPPSASANRIEPASYAAVEPHPEREIVRRPGPPAVPSVALNGYCPVELNRNSRWVLGDVRWTVVYHGWIYRLSGAEQRRQFLAAPERFAPVNSGNDVVLAFNESRVVRGVTTYCATFNGRLYMFSSATTQSEFNRNPERYAVGK